MSNIPIWGVIVTKPDRRLVRRSPTRPPEGGWDEKARDSVPGFFGHAIRGAKPPY